LYPIDLTGKKGVILGVANDRSIAWSVARALAQAGARLALTYQNDRLKERVDRLASTLDRSLVLPCDATDDAQILSDQPGGLSPGPGDKRLLPAAPGEARSAPDDRRRQHCDHDL
jgi:hypothetical protein